MMPYIFTIILAAAIFTAFLIMFPKKGHNESGSVVLGVCLLISGFIFAATTIVAALY